MSSAARRYIESVRSSGILGRCARVVVGRRFHRRSWSAFGDRDERGTHDALPDHVAGLNHLRYGARGARGIGYLEHRLMEVWIEFLVQRFEFLYSVLLQDLQKFALGEFYSVE